MKKIKQRLIILCTSITIFAVSSHAEIYQVEDEAGNMTFSDKPIKGGKPVNLKPITVISSQEMKKRLMTESNLTDLSSQNNMMPMNYGNNNDSNNPNLNNNHRNNGYPEDRTPKNTLPNNTYQNTNLPNYQVNQPAPSNNNYTTTNSATVPFAYQLDILSPTNNQAVLLSNQTLTIKTRSRPALAPEHRTVILINNQIIGSGDNTIVMLNSIGTGEHVIEAQIVDINDQILKAVQNKFYVLQPVH